MLKVSIGSIPVAFTRLFPAICTNGTEVKGDLSKEADSNDYCCNQCSHSIAPSSIHYLILNWRYLSSAVRACIYASIQKGFSCVAQLVDLTEVDRCQYDQSHNQTEHDRPKNQLCDVVATLDFPTATLQEYEDDNEIRKIQSHDCDAEAQYCTCQEWRFVSFPVCGIEIYIICILDCLFQVNSSIICCRLRDCRTSPINLLSCPEIIDDCIFVCILYTILW